MNHIKNRYRSGELLYVILEHIQKSPRRNATTPTNSRLGALQQNWSLNMNKYFEYINLNGKIIIN